MMRIAGTRALVTGGGSGLGKALCRQLSRDGAAVWVSDRDRRAANRTAREIQEANGHARVLKLDVTSPDEIESAASAVEQDGGLEILVNNAGIATSGRLTESSEDQWRRVLDVNLLGAVNLTRRLFPVLQAAPQACVVNIASAAGVAYLPGMISYNVSKAAMIAFSESLRNECYGSTLRVVCVCPSFFETNLLQSSRDLSPRNRRLAEQLTARSPIDADDVARAVLRAIRRAQFMVFPHLETVPLKLLREYFPGLFLRIVARRANQTLQDDE